MYIPTWILIIIIIGVTFYYFSKTKSKKSTVASVDNAEDRSIKTKKNADWLDDENWKETMLQHLAKYPQRTGKKAPTYEEILSLDKDEFKAWLFVMAEPPHQAEILEQMIAHEEKTGSFEKTKREGDSDFTKLILDVFKRERSKEVVDVLTRLSDTASELGHDGGSIVKQAVYAKATSDYFGLGEKMEKDRK